MHAYFIHPIAKIPIHSYIYTRAHTHAHVCPYTPRNTRKQTRTNTHAYIHIYAFVHPPAQQSSRNGQWVIRKHRFGPVVETESLKVPRGAHRVPRAGLSYKQRVRLSDEVSPALYT